MNVVIDIQQVATVSQKMFHVKHFAKDCETIEKVVQFSVGLVARLQALLFLRFRAVCARATYTNPKLWPAASSASGRSDVSVSPG